MVRSSRPAHNIPLSRRTWFAGLGSRARIGLAVAVSAVLGASVLTLPLTLAGAATSTRLATADAYVNQAKPASNYGSATSLRVDASPTIFRTYLRFDLGSVAGAVTDARLEVRVKQSGSAGLRVAPSSPSWTEAGLTWANAPAPGTFGAVTSTSVAGAWVSFDITSAVKAATSPETGAIAPIGLVVETPGSTMLTMGSRESADSPRVTLTTSTSSTPTATPTATPTSTGPSPAPTDGQPSFPIRAAFYYPWFPEAWTQGGVYPYTNYVPSRGYYDGREPAVVSDQIADMSYAGMDAGIASWWGQGSKEDLRIPTLLRAADDTPFRWATYHEAEGYTDPTVSQIASDITHIVGTFGGDSSYLRVNGQPVIFVYAGAADACGMADRWKAANNGRAFIVLKVFSGYANCAAQPNDWHQYAPAVARDSQGASSFSVSPGFWQKGLAPRLTRDPARFDLDVSAMAASNARWQLVTTYNEWGEGTSVEPATAWASGSSKGTYLDILRNRLVGSGSPSPSPSPTLSPTSSPTSSPTLSPSPSPTPSPTPGGDPVIAAAGDIACDPADGNFKGGAGTATNCRQMATSDLLGGTAAVLTLGDNQYENATYDKFMASFDPSWGRVKSRIRPAVGNHEYLTTGASGYYQYFGAAAGDPSRGYYSYDVGAWHLVALNSNCSQVGGCGVGSPQERWLKADLAAHPNTCTLAYWHHPRWSSGQHGSFASMGAVFQALYDAGAELALGGHDHSYERFAAQNPSGGADAGRGVRQFVVGTGGKNHYPISTALPNSEARNADTYGVLRLTLHPSSYDWQFVPEAGATFTDSGTGSCH